MHFRKSGGKGICRRKEKEYYISVRYSAQSALAVDSFAGVRGRRSSFSQKPAYERIALTGIGFTSQNSARANGR